MKVYYDSNGDGTPDTEISNIVVYPEPQTRLDIIGFCSMVIRDREGVLYDTFKTLNFIACRVDDDATNVLFRGYITRKIFEHKQLTLFMKGLAIVLEWKIFSSNYIEAEGLVDSVPAGTNLVLKDNDEGAAFTWNVDQWHLGDQNKALLIVDNTGSTISKTWDSSAIAVTGEDAQVGNNASTLSENDADALELFEDGEFHDVAVELDIDGGGVDIIPDTTFLQAIELDYRIAMRLHSHNAADGVYGQVNLQIKKTTTWVNKRVFVMDLPGVDDQTFWYTGTIRIEGSDAVIQTYVDKTVNDYTSLKGLRFVSSGNSSGNPALDEFYLHVDYVSVRVYYNTSNISPLMAQITDNGASWIAVDGVADWTDTGVSVDDAFFIGENTVKILSDLAAAMGVGISIQSTLTKYIARWYKGTYGLEVLYSIIQLEGIHFYEDYSNNQIVVIAAADFPASGITIDETDYEWEWEYEDDCNNYYRVEVFGSASLGIYAYAEDTEVDSPMIKQIIDDSIMTLPDAQEVANTQLAIWKVKEESIRIPLDGVNAALTVGTTVNLTMARPTVGADDYPIRMIERRKRGITGIETVIYCGLGHTKIEEEIGIAIKKALLLAHRAHTNKLISSPLSGTSIITWTDVGGRVGGVEAVITAEIVNGQSIDNAIDALIAAHKAITADHHAKYTNAEVQALSINNLAEDASPELGAQLDLLSFAITSNNADINYIFGRCELGSVNADRMELAHRDQFSANNWAISQTAGGITILNCGAGGSLYISKNGTAIIHISDINGFHLEAAKTMAFDLGTSILEFSVDGTLAGNSDDAVPTEKAVKTAIANHKGLPNDHHTPTVKYTGAEALAYVNAQGLALANTKVITSQDANLTFTFGRGAIGSPITTFAAFAHRYNMNSTDYAFMQASDGRTYINAMTGKTISFSINAVDKMTMNTTTLLLATGQTITSADEDLTFTFGRLGVGSPTADIMYIAHRDNLNTTSYAIYQTATGYTVINAKTGQSIQFNINNVSKMLMNASSLTMSVPIAMGTNKITGLGDPINAQDAATKAYVATQTIASLTLQQVTDNGAVTTTATEFQGALTVIAPTTDFHAATKVYVDIQPKSIEPHINAMGGGTEVENYITLNAVAEGVVSAFLVFGVDDSKDITINVQFERGDAGADTIDFIIDLGATKMDGSESLSLGNVETATPISFPACGLNGTKYYTYTLAAANYDNGDIIYFRFRMSEAGKTIYVHVIDVIFNV